MSRAFSIKFSKGHQFNFRGESAFDFWQGGPAIQIDKRLESGTDHQIIYGYLEEKR